MAKEEIKQTSRLRCFMHKKYKGFSIPLSEKENASVIVFQQYTHTTDDLAIIAILEKRILEKGDIAEIPLDRAAEAVGMIQNGEATSKLVAKLLDVRLQQ